MVDMESLHFYKKEDIDKLLSSIRDGKIDVDFAINNIGRYYLCPSYYGINVTTEAGSGMGLIVPIEKNGTVS